MEEGRKTRKERGKSAVLSRWKFAVRGISGGKRELGRYDLIKGSLLLPAATFLPRRLTNLIFPRILDYYRDSSVLDLIMQLSQKSDGREGGWDGRISRSLAEAKRITESFNRTLRPTFANPFFDISKEPTERTMNLYSVMSVSLDLVFYLNCRL